MSRSQAIRLGIAAARERGVVFGRTGQELAVHNRAAADAHAETLRGIVSALFSYGVGYTEGLAYHFNRIGVPSPRGGRWTRMTVARLLRRLAISADAHVAVLGSGKTPPDPRGKSWTEWCELQGGQSV
jgi:hypothetical protein